MEHPPTAGLERVRDELAMAAMPIPLGAHERGAAIPSEALELRQSLPELPGGHVAGVCPEARPDPAITTVGRAATAEPLAEPPVLDSGALERLRERLGIELRVSA